MAQSNKTSRSESNGNLFPPGLAVRHVGPTDNEAVRQLFIETQAELVPKDATLEQRIAMKKYTDSSLMDDLARVSTYYREEGRRMWVLENQEREIIAYHDDDIFFYPGWLEAHLQILDGFSQAGMVSGLPVRNAAPGCDFGGGRQ